MAQGMCKDLINGYQCLCPVGYIGSRCEVDIDICNIDMMMANNSDLHHLYHLNNTSLTHLQLFSNNSVHCHNGGTCKDGPGLEYFCVCQPGYTGQLCESLVDECWSNPCQNGARCESLSLRDAGGGFNCICDYG